jgi:hypothetical protein
MRVVVAVHYTYSTPANDSLTQSPPHLLDDLHVVERRVERVGGRTHNVHHRVTSSLGGDSRRLRSESRRLTDFP